MPINPCHTKSSHSTRGGAHGAGGGKSKHGQKAKTKHHKAAKHKAGAGHHRGKNTARKHRKTTHGQFCGGATRPGMLANRGGA